MGQEGSEETGTLQDAGNAVQPTWMGAEANQSHLLRANRHTAGRTDRGVAGSIKGEQEPHRDLLTQLGEVRMGGPGDRVFPSVEPYQADTLLYR